MLEDMNSENSNRIREAAGFFEKYINNNDAEIMIFVKIKDELECISTYQTQLELIGRMEMYKQELLSRLAVRL